MKASLTGYLTRSRSKLPRFRFEIIVGRIEGLEENLSDLFVEIERAGTVVRTQRASSDARGCAKWNEMLTLEKSMTPRTTSSSTSQYEPKPCKIKLKQGDQARPTRLGVADLDLAVISVGSGESEDRCLNLQGAPPHAALYITVTSHTVTLDTDTSDSSEAESDTGSQLDHIPTHTSSTAPHPVHPRRPPAPPRRNTLDSPRSALSNALPPDVYAALQAVQGVDPLRDRSTGTVEGQLGNEWGNVVREVLGDELRIVEDQLIDQTRAKRVAETANEQLTVRYKQAENTIADLSQQLESIQKAHSAQEQAFAAAREERDTALRQLDLEVTQARTEVDLAGQRESELQQQIQDLQGELATWSVQMVEARRVLEEGSPDKDAPPSPLLSTDRRSRVSGSNTSPIRPGEYSPPLSPHISPCSSESSDAEDISELSLVAGEEGAEDQTQKFNRAQAKLQQRVAKLEQTVDRLRSERTDLAQQHSDAKKEIARLKDELALASRTSLADARDLQLRLQKSMASEDSLRKGVERLEAELRQQKAMHEAMVQSQDVVGEQEHAVLTAAQTRHVQGDAISDELVQALADRDVAQRKTQEFADRLAQTRARMVAENTLLQQRVVEAEKEQWRVSEELSAQIQEVQQSLTERDMDLVSARADTALWQRRHEEVREDLDKLGNALAAHVTDMDERLARAFQNDPVLRAIHILKHHRLELEGLREQLSESLRDSESLTESVQKLKSQLADLKRERLDTFAQIDTDHKFFNRRVRNLETEVQRCYSTRETLNKRTNTLRQERDKAISQGRAEILVLQGLTNSQRTQLNQLREQASEARALATKQQRDFQARIQQMTQEQEVMTMQLKRIHDEYHEEEERLRRERDSAIIALRTATSSARHSEPRANGHSLPRPGNLSLRHSETLSSVASLSVGVGQRSVRTLKGLKGLMDHIKLDLGHSSGSTSGREMRARSLESPPLPARGGEGGGDVLERAIADKEELKQALKQTVDHLATIVEQKERSLHELKERNQSLTRRIQRLLRDRSGSEIGEQSETGEMQESIEELVQQVAELQADKETLAATARTLGDHLCQVMTEREDQVQALVVERNALAEQLHRHRSTPP